MSIAVKVKHSKVVHDATVEPSDTGATFKERLYQITGASNLLLLLLLFLHAHLSRMQVLTAGAAPLTPHLPLTPTPQGVPADRQKILTKKSWKGALKDDAVMSTMTIKPKQKFMLTGTSTGIPTAPTEEIVFVEDMTDAQKAAAAAAAAAGGAPP